MSATVIVGAVLLAIVSPALQPSERALWKKAIVNMLLYLAVAFIARGVTQ